MNGRVAPPLPRPRLLALAGLLGVVATTAPAVAQIRDPGAHPTYSFDAEFHGAVGMSGTGKRDGAGWGVGFRGTVPVMQNGFVPRLNNSVGIGFGLDWLWYGDIVRCQNETAECTRDAVYSAFIPVVMQWNFWLSPEWSVFGEPGLGVAIASRGDERADAGVQPTIYIGARWLMVPDFALVFRIGYPTVSVGLGFFN